MASVRRPRVSVRTHQSGRAGLWGHYNNGFPIKGPLSKTLILTIHLPTFLKRSVLKRTRESS